MKFVYSIYHFLWSFLGAMLYGFPSKRIHVIGITGTKGKSTTIALLAHILSCSGKKVAFISSSHMQIGDRIEKNNTGNSMPGRLFLQRFLHKAHRLGCEFAIVEVTSEGVVQHRHKFILWENAVFLDIQPEHIERHGSFRNYLRAKISFFTYAAKKASEKTKFFVYSHDQYFHLFVQAAHHYPVILFSETLIKDLNISIPETLPGDFNKINIAAAISIAKANNISDENIHLAVSSFPGLLGRMTVISKNPVYAVVDYAHTPDSLQAVYEFLNSSIRKKDSNMICVLGAAGGGRDVWKRSVMGLTASRFCSTIILANEDPYNEHPEKIFLDIQKGIKKGNFSGELYKIEDRGVAIKKAVSLSKEGDIIVCTGKGSESSIHMANKKKIEWSESEFLFAELQRQNKYQRK